VITTLVTKKVMRATRSIGLSMFQANIGGMKKYSRQATAITATTADDANPPVTDRNTTSNKYKKPGMVRSR
jgi:hypothetical protein